MRSSRKLTTQAPIGSDQRARVAAFSLIEVLIALAIFAAASTVLVSAFAEAMLARDRSVGNDLLNTDIRDVRMQLLLEPDLEAAEDGGDYPSLNHGEATWRAVIEPTEIVDLFRVELEIEFSDPKEGQSGSYSEQLYLLRPTWSEGDERSQLLEDKRAALEDSRDFF
jgi:general secretion pathway protein I